MGVVYLAIDTTVGREVALKTLRVDLQPDVADECRTRERFFLEGTWSGRSSHPNVVEIYEQGEEDGRPYIVMEWLDGEDLKSILGRGVALGALERLRIVVEVGKGLAYAHARGLVHRDVKPGNIFICKSGGVKILDFGLAHTAKSRLTRVGQVLGTPHYMSPEQILGQPVDARSDVFSLGSVLYELITGRKTFPATSGGLARLSFQIVNEDPLALETLVPHAPAALSRIVSQAMAKRLDDRHRTAGDLVADLERFLISPEGRAYVKASEPGIEDYRAGNDDPTEILGRVAAEPERTFMRTLENDVESFVALGRILRLRSVSA